MFHCVPVVTPVIHRTLFTPVTHSLAFSPIQCTCIPLPAWDAGFYLMLPLFFHDVLVYMCWWTEHSRDQHYSNTVWNLGVDVDHFAVRNEGSFGMSISDPVRLDELWHTALEANLYNAITPHRRQRKLKPWKTPNNSPMAIFSTLSRFSSFPIPPLPSPFQIESNMTKEVFCFAIIPHVPLLRSSPWLEAEEILVPIRNLWSGFLYAISNPQCGFPHSTSFSFTFSCLPNATWVWITRDYNS